MFLLKEETMSFARNEWHQDNNNVDEVDKVADGCKNSIKRELTLLSKYKYFIFLDCLLLLFLVF